MPCVYLDMRKNIDIPDEIVKDLKKMAVDADMDLKNYIQDLLVQHVKKHFIANKLNELERKKTTRRRSKRRWP